MLELLFLPLTVYWRARIPSACLLMALVAPLDSSATLLPSSSMRDVSITGSAMSTTETDSISLSDSAPGFVPFDSTLTGSLVIDSFFGNSLASQQNSTISAAGFGATGNASANASSLNPTSTGDLSALSTFSLTFQVSAPATYLLSGSLNRAGSALPATGRGSAFILLEDAGGNLAFQEAVTDSFAPFFFPVELVDGVDYDLSAGASAFANLDETNLSSAGTSSFTFNLVIPEPRTAMLLAMGVLALALLRRLPKLLL